MANRNALITNIDLYMGAAIKKKFESLGINVITGTSPLKTEARVNELISSCEEIDILVANLA